MDLKFYGLPSAPEKCNLNKIGFSSVLHTWGAGGSGSSPAEGATRGEVGQNGRQSVLGSIGVRVVMR